MSFKIACPACKEPVARDAAKCPHCQTEYTEEQLAERKSDAKGAFIGCGVIALILIFSVFACSGDDEIEADDISEKPAVTAKRDAVDYFRKLMITMKPCDTASVRVSEAGQSGDVVAVYQAATNMSKVCLDTPEQIKSVEIPTSVGQSAYKSLVDARTACENAYTNRWYSAEKLKDALDDTSSISKLAELKDAMEGLEAGILVCVAAAMQAPISLGATAADLAIDELPVQ